MVGQEMLLPDAKSGNTHVDSSDGHPRPKWNSVEKHIVTCLMQ